MYYFIVNEKSGGGAASENWIQIRNELVARGTEYKVYFTKKRGDAKEYAARICEHSEASVRMVCVGGDGTVNEVINGITDFNRVYLGVIPLGSGNDFASALSIAFEPKEALRRILEDDESCLIDVGEVCYEDGTSRYFGISAGVGMDAIVCKKAQTGRLKKVLRHFGLERLTYVLLTVWTILTMPRIKATISLDDKKPVFVEKMIYAAALNMPAEGGGVMMAPHSSYTDGKLSLCMAHSITKLMAPVSLLKLIMGRHEKAREFVVRDAVKIRITATKAMVVHTDGEYGGEVDTVTFVCKKHKLRIVGTKN